VVDDDELSKSRTGSRPEHQPRLARIVDRHKIVNPWFLILKRGPGRMKS